MAGTVPAPFGMDAFSFPPSSPPPPALPPAGDDASPPGHPHTPATPPAGSANAEAFLRNAALPRLGAFDSVPSHSRTPLSPPLYARAGASSSPATDSGDPPDAPSIVHGPHDRPPSSRTAPMPVQRPSLRTEVSVDSTASTVSSDSALYSPAVSPLAEVLPLPTPLGAGDPSHAPPLAALPPSTAPSNPARDSVVSLGPLADGMLSVSPTKKKRAYQGLASAGAENQGIGAQAQRNEASHARNRSISEFVPEAMHNERPRHVTISSGAQAVPESTPPPESHMHREAFLSAERTSTRVSGARPTTTIPTPPASSAGGTGRGSLELREDEEPAEYVTIRQDPREPEKSYRVIRPLGQGTFSKVVLATSEELPDERLAAQESRLDPRQLVAVKVVEYGPAGGADEERMELSLKREIDILRSIRHPSVIQLKAFDLTDTHARLVLNYCPGGDLFELASERRDALPPALVQRIFAELVCAVRYLHGQCIVHRDIKLENVLVNVPAAHLHPAAPQRHRHPLVALTDFGLSRRIAPAAPLLATRCGSEDYCAPEILLGQPYDGRATDAWALGALLYALMEGRLPFDAPPGAGAGARARARPAHRIARCDWIWCAFGDEHGDWAGGAPAAEWEGARRVVEGLLRKVGRGRWSLDRVGADEWVRGGILVEGGLRRLRGPLDDDGGDGDDDDDAVVVGGGGGEGMEVDGGR